MAPDGSVKQKSEMQFARGIAQFRFDHGESTKVAS
jgi:hypothetical protein